MAKIAFLFAGQGAQYSGMGKELYECSERARSVFYLADEALGDVSKTCFSGNSEQLSQTIHTQPAVFTVALAAAFAAQAEGIQADMIAGFSLGEMAGLCYSGILSLMHGFDLIKIRATAMDECAQKYGGGMAAVVGLADETVEGITAKIPSSYCVNYNCPKQLVVAAEKTALQQVLAEVKAAGGRAIPLSVSGAFHTPFMEEASKKLQEHLKNVTLQKPHIPLYSNLTAQPYGENAAELIASQVKSAVRWQQTVLNMSEAGADIFIELGAGKVLSGLVKKTLPDAKVFNIEDKQSLQNTVAAVKELQKNQGVSC